ncbi:branched-chain amino acid ABC transporter permease [Frankia sp. Cas4]|uniref:branched-chain amino acid ABC transporter permease n=2 Tax=Frankia TaxID=1854 RepID=UPI002AD5003A|nr:branched-chain amino acid ABC transporter permease [Frankia sp. Cas4]
MSAALPWLRRLAVYLGGAVLVAVVTGPSGDADHPFAGIRGSLFAPRFALFAALATGTWAGVMCAARVRAGAGGWLLRSVRAACSGLPVGDLGGFGGFGGPAVGAWGRAVATVGMLGIALIVPLGLSAAAAQSLVTDIGIYALLALGLNVVVGYAGLLDLGYIAFFAIGAYTTAYFTSRTAMPWHSPVILNPFVVIPIAVVAAMAAGVALGGPTLRLRGDYLAIVTLGFGEIVQLLANNVDGVTGGSRGVFGVPPLSLDVGALHYAWGLAPLPYYYLLLAVVIVVIVVFGRLERSHVGRAWAAIREDEFAAEISGVATVRMKLLAFSIGASVSGFAGVLFATKQFFNPQTFSLQASILVLTIVIFGGMGSRFGVVLGAVVLQGLAFFLRDVVPPADRYIYFGVVVVIMMTFRPQGLLPPRRGERVGLAVADDAAGDAGVPGAGGIGDVRDVGDMGDVGGALPAGGPAG